MFIIIVAAMHLARDVLMPIALSLLLSFLLTPLVLRLQQLHIPRVPAVLITAIISFSLIGGLGYTVANQFVDLAQKLPEYKDNIRSKLSTFRMPSNGVFSRATETIRELGNDLSSTTGTTATTSPANLQSTAGVILFNPRQVGTKPPALPAPPSQTISSSKPEAVPVRIVEGPSSSLQLIRTIAGPIVRPLGTAGLVVLFVLFILLQREDLRDRVILLIARGRLTQTTEAINDAATRVSRYLLMQLIVNACYGLPVAIGLYFLGVPNAVLWGILATLLRFIPYAGPWIAASFPIILSLAVFNGWTKPLLVIGLFVVLELISNNIIEPLLYGASTGVTPIALIVAAVFWTWLWGGVGLFLSTPLTVCVVVLGRYVPQLSFLNVLLGDDPGLAPEARLYQRLLAMNAEEAEDLILKQLQTTPKLIEVYDKVIIPALSLAEADRHRGYLDEEHCDFIYDTIEEIIATLGEQLPTEDATNPEERNAAEALMQKPMVVCLPARDQADEIAANMLAHVISEAGRFYGSAVSVRELASEMLDEVERSGAKTACISALPPFSVAHARYLSKRLRTRFPEIHILVGLWNAHGDLPRACKRIINSGANEVTTTICETMERIGA
jgi:predicted PurR-regulated permease PerM